MAPCEVGPPNSGLQSQQKALQFRQPFNESFLFCCTGHFIMFSVITNIYNINTKGPILTELFTATGKLKKVIFEN
jgi:hypothetical protein